MKTFTVFWHYLGNHGAYVRQAESAHSACRDVILGFSEDFALKADLVAVEGAHKMRPAREIIKQPSTTLEAVQTTMRSLVDEASTELAGDLWDGRVSWDDFANRLSDKYMLRFKEEWEASDIPDEVKNAPGSYAAFRAMVASVCVKIINNKNEGNNT